MMKLVIAVYLLLGAVILAVPNSNVLLQRSSNKLDSGENSLVPDTRYLKDDLIQTFGSLTNGSFKFQPEVKEKNSSSRQNADGSDDLMSKVQKGVQILKRSLREERELNSRTRRWTCALSPLWRKVETYFTDLTRKLDILNVSLLENMEAIEINLRDKLPKAEASSLPESCLDLFNQGYNASGVYKIRPAHMYEINVYCDMDTADGGWLVFQRREDGSVDFYRNWKDYKNGFGDMRSEFWLGNEILHHLTRQSTWQLRVDLEDFEGNSRYAEYSRFSLAPEADGYRVSVGSYHGNANDSLSSHNNLKFVTKDENDVNGCSKAYRGGWWYGNCHASNLNGLYLSGTTSLYAKGVVWYYWRGHYYSLKRTQMKLRPT